jgi:hypothetical protein
LINVPLPAPEGPVITNTGALGTRRGVICRSTG